MNTSKLPDCLMVGFLFCLCLLRPRLLLLVPRGACASGLWHSMGIFTYLFVCVKALVFMIKKKKKKKKKKLVKQYYHMG